MWPKDLKAFQEYWNQGLQQLEIDDKVRIFLNRLVDLKFLHPALSVVFGRLHRFVTTGFLPPEARAQMQLEWSPAQQRRFEQLLTMIGTVNAWMPRVVRQMPFNLVLWDFRRRQRKGLPLV